jgi:hypothetical protein
MPQRRPKPLYPPEWPTFSRLIRFERAQGRCECTGLGLCGLHCTHPGPRRCVEVDQTPARWARGRIVLTVAHLCDCEPLCAIPEHVLACCQRCHVRIDQTMHSLHAAETRRRAKERDGQRPLPFMK